MKKLTVIAFLIGAAQSMVGATTAASASFPALRVSENRHFLVRADGSPFFWLGDTAWQLFHFLNREETEAYLKKRAEQGYTVIQAVALAEFDGLEKPNRQGHHALRNNDPLQPNESYFEHIDWVLGRAAAHGLYVGLLPTWGDKWNKKWGKGPEIFTRENAGAYGEWLGRRYARANVIWILGGDRPIENDAHREIMRAMARGLRRGDGGAHLITFHPSGGHGSSEWLHDEDWLDFNLRQNGHTNEFSERYVKTRADYDRTPIKPVIDAEPIYEDHPVSFKAKTLGHSVAADVRRAFYWDVFTGACGHTYGHHSVWQMFAPGRSPVNTPLLPWNEAVDQPGARQMQFGRRLIESRPFLTRIPADDVIVPAAVPSAVPGEGRYRFVATRDAKGSYAMVYVPIGRKFSVRMNVIAGPKVKAWWFNPRNGAATAAGEFANAGEREFTPPQRDDDVDWVLVLDDAAQNFPAPGVVRR
jgi:hypothetical protein